MRTGSRNNPNYSTTKGEKSCEAVCQLRHKAIRQRRYFPNTDRCVTPEVPFWGHSRWHNTPASLQVTGPAEHRHRPHTHTHIALCSAPLRRRAGPAAGATVGFKARRGSAAPCSPVGRLGKLSPLEIGRQAPDLLPVGRHGRPPAPRQPRREATGSQSGHTSAAPPPLTAPPAGLAASGSRVSPAALEERIRGWRGWLGAPGNGVQTTTLMSLKTPVWSHESMILVGPFQPAVEGAGK